MHWLLAVRADPGARTAGELIRSIGVVPDLPGVRSAKSCVPAHYGQSRAAVEAPLKAFLFRRRPVFRAHRYDGRRASEDRFASRIKAAFDGGILPSPTRGQEGRVG